MRVAITGGSGFVGKALATYLIERGHEVILISRRPEPLDGATTSAGDLSDVDALAKAFQSCKAVAHCAGINRESGRQTFQSVHITGTANVVEACRLQGVSKLVFTSFLKARAGTKSGYHESKWRAEEIIRSSQLDFTILKPGVIFGKGDHMISHMTMALKLSPIFGLVGGDISLRPIALPDFIRALEGSLFDPRLSKNTFAVLGPEEIKLSEAARRVASAMHRPVLPMQMPLAFLYGLARIMECTMKEPLLSESQITMIAEGLSERLSENNELPDDLKPMLPFSRQILEKLLRN